MNTATTTVRRIDGRAADETRPVRIEVEVSKYAEGSALIRMGDTHVLITASVESRVPPFLAGSGKGWMTAEYAMLPRATSSRSQREVTKGRPAGRSAEIQRLIGRSLRAAVDLVGLGERTLTLDCDVLQADGGTRTASITGAYVAAALACARLYLQGDLKAWPLREQVAAVSVGLVGGVPLLDLDAPEDQAAEVDFNVVGTAQGALIEVQGTGERRSFARRELDQLLDLGLAGIQRLAAAQNDALAPHLGEVEALRQRGAGGRRSAPAKDERDLWKG
ncbi:MAG TPA: ribonuclease PH [Kofleriaceae bacterium]|jgi:ribonuclease PH